MSLTTDRPRSPILIAYSGFFGWFTDTTEKVADVAADVTRLVVLWGLRLGFAGAVGALWLWLLFKVLSWLT